MFNIYKDAQVIPPITPRTTITPSVPDYWFDKPTGMKQPLLIEWSAQPPKDTFWRNALRSYIANVVSLEESKTRELLTLSVIEDSFKSGLLDVVELQAYELVLEEFLTRTRFASTKESLLYILSELVENIKLRAMRVYPTDTNPLALAVSGAYSKALIDNVDYTKHNHALAVVRWFVTEYSLVA